MEILVKKNANQPKNTKKQVVTIKQQQQPKNRPPGTGQSRSARKRRNRQMSIVSQSKGGLGSAIGRNPYLRSLLDPFNNPGARIPDEDCQMTGTVQLVTEGYFQIPVASVEGAVAFGFRPQLPFSTRFGHYTTTAGSTFSSTLAFDGDAMTGYTQFKDIADMIRCTGACLEYEYIGTTAEDRGFAFGFQYLPNSTNIDSYISGLDITGILASPYLKQWSFRDGGRVIWRPLDNIDHEYNKVDWSPDGYAGNYGRYPSALVLGVIGGTTGSNVIKYKCTSNYEYVPKLSVSSFVKTSASVTDPNIFAQASNVLSQFASSAIPSSEDVFRVVGPTIQQGLLNASGYAASAALGAYLGVGSRPRLPTIAGPRISY